MNTSKNVSKNKFVESNHYTETAVSSVASERFRNYELLLQIENEEQIKVPKGILNNFFYLI